MEPSDMAQSSCAGPKDSTLVMTDAHHLRLIVALIEVGKRLKDKDIVYADIQTMGWAAGCDLREDSEGKIKGETEGDLVVSTSDWIEVTIAPRKNDPAWGPHGWQSRLTIKIPLDARPSSLLRGISLGTPFC